MKFKKFKRNSKQKLEKFMKENACKGFKKYNKNL